jgi:hypothetical protein
MKNSGAVLPLPPYVSMLCLIKARDKRTSHPPPPAGVHGYGTMLEPHVPADQN